MEQSKYFHLFSSIILSYHYVTQGVSENLKCKAVITDNLEKCSNTFSNTTTEMKHIMLDNFKDFSSREFRYKVLCRKVNKDQQEVTLNPQKGKNGPVNNANSIQGRSEQRNNANLGQTKQEKIGKRKNANSGLTGKGPENVAKFEKARKGPGNDTNSEHSGIRGKGGNKCDIPEYRDICGKEYKALIIDQMPFSFQMMITLEKMLMHCCGSCASLCPSKTISHMSKTYITEIGIPDIMFPILAKSGTQRMHDYSFLPIHDAPSVFYFTKKHSKAEQSYQVLNACQNLWPLLTICLLMALISGFIGWSIETRVNEEEFPRSFHQGLFEGFWWSFISMTTVGYGDKAPKSRAGRIFSIIWILIGITICSMFTASLTTEITEWTTVTPPSLNGRKVGRLKYRLLDALIIAKHGGIIMEVEYDNVTQGVQLLAELLKNDTISGFVVDTNTYHHVNMVSSRRDISMRKMMRTEIHYTGEKLSFGALFKDSKEFAYFERYIHDNELTIEACNNYKMNARMMTDATQNFILDPAGGMFYNALYVTIGALIVIGIFGVCYEWRRHKVLRRMKIVDASMIKRIDEDVMKMEVPDQK